MDTKYKGIYFTEFKGSFIPQILQELYIEKVYEPILGGKKDLTILDIGANIGLFSFYASEFAKKIYAVEPSKEHIDVMRYMLKQNDINNVEIIEGAMSLEDGKGDLFHCSNRTAFSLNSYTNDVGTKEVVNLIRFDTLFDKYKIDYADFIKFDVEGSEVEIICAEGFKNIKDRVKSILVEYHTWSGRNPNQLTTALMDYGFVVSRVPAKAQLFYAEKR